MKSSSDLLSSVLACLSCVLLLWTATTLLAAEPDALLPNPSSAILNEPIQIVSFPGMPGSYYKVGGTVTLAIPHSKLTPNLVSRKPQITVMGLTESGTLTAQMPVVPFVEASSELTLPLRDGGSADYFILQYPFSTMLPASEKVRWVCVQSEKLRECVPSPPPKAAVPHNPWQKPESKIELTSSNIYTERSGVAEPLVALTGVAEVVIVRMDDPYPMELSITLVAKSHLGRVLAKQSLKAKLFFLRHSMIPNPAYDPKNPLQAPPFLTIAIPLYIFSGSMSLPSDFWELTMRADSPAYSIQPVTKIFRSVDHNNDSAINHLDDLNGDGVVNHGDWLGMVPRS